MKKQIIGNSIKFTFDGLDAITFDSTKVSQSNRDYAVMHGFQARIGDNAAIARKQVDGTAITVTESMRREAILELVNHYESGSTEWSIRGGPRAIAQNPTWLAIAQKRGVEYSVIAAEKAAADLAELEGM